MLLFAEIVVLLLYEVFSRFIGLMSRARESVMAKTTKGHFILRALHGCGFQGVHDSKKIGNTTNYGSAARPEHESLDFFDC